MYVKNAVLIKDEMLQVNNGLNRKVRLPVFFLVYEGAAFFSGGDLSECHSLKTAEEAERCASLWESEAYHAAVLKFTTT